MTKHHETYEAYFRPSPDEEAQPIRDREGRLRKFPTREAAGLFLEGYRAAVSDAVQEGYRAEGAFGYVVLPTGTKAGPSFFARRPLRRPTP